MNMPNSPEAERALLGSVILSNHLASQAVAALRPEDFYSPVNRDIFLAIAELENSEIDALTIREAMKGHGKKLDLPYCSSLIVGLPNMARLDPYIAILKSQSALRRLMKVAAQLEARASEGDDPIELANETLTEIEEIQRRIGSASKTFRSIQELDSEVGAVYERLHRGDSTAIPTGFESLDQATRGGIHQGELWVIAAITGRGKSSWALNAARMQGERGIGAAIVSREMSDFENYVRLQSPMSNVAVWKVRTGMWPDDYNRLQEIRPFVARLPLWINSSTSNIFEIRSQVREIVKSQGVKTLFIDYLQLLNCSDNAKQSTRAQEVATVSRVLKEIAMDNQIGVFALAQFNRYANHNERPEIHHLAESSGIEKDASVVLILDMPERKENEREWDCTMRIAKHRNGPLLSLAYRYSGDTLTFSEAA